MRQRGGDGKIVAMRLDHPVFHEINLSQDETPLDRHIGKRPATSKEHLHEMLVCVIEESRDLRELYATLEFYAHQLKAAKVAVEFCAEKLAEAPRAEPQRAAA